MDEGLHKLPQNPALCKSVSVSKTPLYIPRCGLPTFHPLHMLERKTENSHGLLSALPVITVPFSRTSKGCFQQISFWLFFFSICYYTAKNMQIHVFVPWCPSFPSTEKRQPQTGGPCHRNSQSCAGTNFKPSYKSSEEALARDGPSSTRSQEAFKLHQILHFFHHGH